MGAGARYAAQRMSLSSYPGALEWLFAQTRGGAPRTKERMTTLIERLELRSPPKVVHVVGTNGKGSVTAMLAAAFEEAGLRTGRFISPHVVDFRERIAVDNAWIPEEAVLEFVRSLPRLEPAPAFFELTLALALAHFAHEQVDIAVVEAGVGARHDATSALENVCGVVITQIGRDHLETLGPTLRDVARDKADAVREGVPTITGTTGEALEVIREMATERRSPLYIRTSHDLRFRLPETANLSRTERHNRQLAAALLRLHGIGEAAIRTGLEARLPARAERFWVADKEVLLDGAHNPSAAGALLEHTRAPFVLLFGAFPKKLGAETLGVLEPHAKHIILTNASPGETNALQREGLTFVAEPTAALETALSHCEAGNQVVVAGSFYLAGRLRPWLLAHASAPPPHR